MSFFSLVMPEIDLRSWFGTTLYGVFFQTTWIAGLVYFSPCLQVAVAYQCLLFIVITVSCSIMVNEMAWSHMEPIKKTKPP
jgi:hypothetical protein